MNLVADIDGVVLLGEQPVPGAGDALIRFDGEGWNVLFVTNNSSRGAADIADRIHRIAGYPAGRDQVLHSGRAAATLVGKGPALVLGGTGIVEGLEERGIEMTTEWQAAQVVVVGLDRALTYDRLRDAVLAVRAGAALWSPRTTMPPTRHRMGSGPVPVRWWQRWSGPPASTPTSPASPTGPWSIWSTSGWFRERCGWLVTGPKPIWSWPRRRGGSRSRSSLGCRRLHTPKPIWWWLIWPSWRIGWHRSVTHPDTPTSINEGAKV